MRDGKGDDVVNTSVKGYGKVRRKILCSMILVPFVPFLLALGVGYSFFTSAIEADTDANLRRVVADHAHMISSFMEERQSDLEFVINTYPMQALDDQATLEEVFRHLRKKSPAFVDLGFINSAGRHLSYVGPYSLHVHDYSKADWFQEVRRQGVFVSDVYLGFRNVPHFIVAVSREVNGVWWVLRAAIDTAYFSQLVEGVRIGETGEAYLVNREGILQTDRRSGGEVLDSAQEQPPEPHEGICLFLREDFGGESGLYATTWIGNGRWQLVVRRAKADAYRDVQEAAYIILAILMAGGAVIVGLALYTSNKIQQALLRTVAEKEQLRDQLVRAARLAELGEMAAGFAHEINNPLQIMKSDLSYVEMLLDELRTTGHLSDEDRREVVESMEQLQLQIGRCAAITQSILKFGRQSAPAVERINLVEFIPEVLSMVERKAKVNGVRIRVDLNGAEYGAGLPSALADPGQLQQVLLNLLNNALDAIHERHGVSGGSLDVIVLPAEGGGVRIKVVDNGSGIAPENLEKIFAPFFTTKPPGKGTGLGLSVCYGIVQNMGGTMQVRSRQGEGTTFLVDLPSAGARDDQRPN